MQILYNKVLFHRFLCFLHQIKTSNRLFLTWKTTFLVDLKFSFINDFIRKFLNPPYWIFDPFVVHKAREAKDLQLKK